jgi:hypothetical protein
MRSTAALSFAWPLSASKSQTLAKLSYNSETATVLSYKVPALPAGEEIVRIGFHHPSTGSWSGIATAASNFADGKDKKLQLLLNEQGDVYHIGFKSLDLPSSSKGGSKKDDMSVEVVPMKAGSTVHLNKPVLLNAEGKLDGAPEEKTFLQKYVQRPSLLQKINDNTDYINRYWWAIGLFLVFQVAMGGGGKE